MLEHVGRYRIVRPLGRGAMGLVYLAEDPVLNRSVAIKMLDLTSGEDRDRAFLRERLLRDAKAAAALSHPNIVNVHDVLEEGEHAYVVMEYISGESLAEYLAKQPNPATAFTVSVLRQIAAALDYTHSREIIHRDIKPGNVMIAQDGTVKLLDFGIARLSDARTNTPTGFVMGTVEYMSPEQIKGETVDGRADQFSLGAIAYQLLSGSTLYGQHSLATLAYKLVNEKPAPVRSLNASLPKAVDSVIDKALSKNPRDRYTSCGEFAAAVAQTFGASTPIAGSEKTKRTWLVAASLGAAAFFVVVGGGLAVRKFWAPTGIPVSPAKEVIAITPLPPQVAHDVPKEELAKAPRPKAVAKLPPPARIVVAPPEKKPDEVLEHPVILAKEQMKNGDYAGAVRSLTQAIALRPKASQPYHLRGLALQNLQKNEEAIRDYSEAIRLNPGDALSYADRGLCYNRTLKDELAIADLNRALEMRPDLATALNGRAVYFLRHNEFRNAIRDCDAALRLNPEYWQAYQNRGRAKRGLGDEAGALADLKKAKELRNGPE